MADSLDDGWIPWSVDLPPPAGVLVRVRFMRDGASTSMIYDPHTTCWISLNPQRQGTVVCTASHEWKAI